MKVAEATFELQRPDGFAFDPSCHVYTLHGDRIPGVTSVLTDAGVLPDHSFTDPFYAERGSAVHRAIQLDLEDDLNVPALDVGLMPFLARWWEIRELLNLRPLAVEAILCDPVLRYGGMVDFVGHIQHTDDVWILDWKTGHHHPGFFVQVAGGYAPIVKRLLGVDHVRVGIVSLATDNPKLIAAPGAIGDHHAVFRAALTVHQWRGANRCNR